jgi:hypothetical protein
VGRRPEHNPSLWNLYFSSSVLSFIGVVYPPLSTGIEIDVAATPPMEGMEMLQGQRVMVKGALSLERFIEGESGSSLRSNDMRRGRQNDKEEN